MNLEGGRKERLFWQERRLDTSLRLFLPSPMGMTIPRVHGRRWGTFGGADAQMLPTMEERRGEILPSLSLSLSLAEAIVAVI